MPVFFLRRINAGQSNLVLHLVGIQHGDGVAVSNADNPARDGYGIGSAGQRQQQACKGFSHVGGTSLQPQCLQTFASRRTSSLQSGQRTWDSGVGALGSPLREGMTRTANKAKMLKMQPRMNHLPPSRPRASAAMAVMIAMPSQMKKNSIISPVFLS